jgi:erythrocyte band 7 integral membrane protein
MEKRSARDAANALLRQSTDEADLERGNNDADDDDDPHIYYRGGSAYANVFLTTCSVIFTLLTFPLTVWFRFRTVPMAHVAMVLRNGRWDGVLHQAGVLWVWPFVDDVQILDTRTRTLVMKAQNMLTSDSVTVGVDAIVYYRIVSPGRAWFAIDNVHESTQRLAQTALRNVIGAHTLQETTSHRDKMSMAIREHMQDLTSKWGVRVERVELKDLELPANTQRAMAAEAEAVREAAAKVAAARGEEQAAGMLRNAADEMMRSPGAMQLRYLQTLATIATEHNSTIIFPVPMGGGSDNTHMPVLSAGTLAQALLK